MSRTMVLGGLGLVLIVGCEGFEPLPLAGEATEAACSDGFDNDGDGNVDCDDFGCEGLGACVEEDPLPPVDSPPPSEEPPEIGTACTYDPTHDIADSCSGSALCLGGVCEPAFPGDYEITVAGATVPPFDPWGDCWDSDCLGPDLYVEVRVDGERVGSTATVRDTASPRFDAAPIAVPLTEGSRIELILNEADPTDYESVRTCSFVATGELARSRDLSCIGTAGSIVARLSPR